MNYLKSELLEQLAAEYVLGTMPRLARRRFERVMMDSYKARQAVWDWERQITPITGAVQEVTPPKRVWQNIERRINPRQPESPRQFLGWWRGFSALSTAFAVALAMVVVLRPVPEAGPDQVALFNDDKAQPLWLVAGSIETGRLSIRPVNAQAVAVDEKAFELWMLPTSGQPQSLGLMPVSGGRTEKILSPQLLTILQQSKGLAISLEPEGGSKTGLPTGPVLYQAPLVGL